jgi:hypothetical protein
LMRVVGFYHRRQTAAFAYSDASVLVGAVR